MTELHVLFNAAAELVGCKRTFDPGGPGDLADAIRGRLGGLHEELDAVQGELVEYEASNDDLRAELQTAERDIIHHQERASDIAAERDEMEDKVNSLSDTVGDLYQREAELADRVRDLESQLVIERSKVLP